MAELGRDLPLLCEACLGPSPYVRMTRHPNGVECQITKRPCTMFRWSTGTGGFKTTCVSYEAAASRNMCQACMTDLTFGLPVAVRDAFLRAQAERAKEAGAQPPSQQQQQLAVRGGAGDTHALALGSAAAELALSVVTNDPKSRVGQDFQLALREQRAALDPEAARREEEATVDRAVRAVMAGAHAHALGATAAGAASARGVSWGSGGSRLRLPPL